MSDKPNSSPTKFLFLYTELAGYFLACVKALMQEYPVEVHIVRWPVNKEAPFQLTIPDGAKVYDKQQYNREQLMELSHCIAPDLVFCTGWLDKDYVAVAKSFKKQVPVLVGMDNHWFGTVKQRAARLLAHFTLHRIFTHAFVAGAPQHTYALKLGFKKEHILQGYYAADVNQFQKAYLESQPLKKIAFPNRFIYVGRYVKQKGVEDLWEAFVQLQQEMPNDWELWCLGTGPLEDVAVKHSQIKHLGFVQPQQMQRYISQAGVFVLPSHYEPWGVVVHEFAAAGFPLLCSSSVGAATAFLKDKVNGYLFKAGEVGELKKAMEAVILSSEADLLQMGEQSVVLALHHTPSKWAAKLMKLVRS